MKTAVIYSGQARSFKDVFLNQYWQVLRKLPNPEFFVSVEDDAQAQDMTRLWEKFPQEKVHIEYVQQPQIPEPPTDPKWLAMYPPSSPPQAILRQFWALQQAWKFADIDQLEFNLVVRIRPDIAFARCDLPDFEEIQLRTCMSPWWARWGGMNDRFAIMGSYAALAYFTTFSAIESLMRLGCPLHPETLLAASMENHSPVQHTLATEFVTVRLDGTVVPVSATLIDQVEYARSR